MILRTKMKNFTTLTSRNFSQQLMACLISFLKGAYMTVNFTLSSLMCHVFSLKDAVSHLTFSNPSGNLAIEN